LKARVRDAAYAVLDLLRNPRYAVPLVLNLTGSVWFFLLIGQAGAFLSSLIVILMSPGLRALFCFAMTSEEKGSC
jgi:hypothetical protein